MDIQITFRGMDHSELMEKYAYEQLAKILKFLEESEREPIYIHLIFQANPKKNHHEVTINLKTPSIDMTSDYKGPEMYDLLDRVLDIAYRQLLEHKRKEVREKKTADDYKGA